MNSSSSSISDPLNINFNESIEHLHTFVMNRLESFPSTNEFLQRCFHLIPVIFRFLRKNLQSQQQLSDEYNHLSDNIQKIFSTFAQYSHDRREHENEIFFLKNKISQIIGQIGYTQDCLEQYWSIIYSLEHETERLKILLRNPEFLQMNRQQLKTFQETQQFQLNRFLKEIERLQVLIHKQKGSIEAAQKQIEMDVKEIQRLKPILHQIKWQQSTVQNHWSRIGLLIRTEACTFS